MLKKWKLQQVLVYSLAIIVWVNNFQTPEIQAVLSSFFCDDNDIAGGSNRGGGWGTERLDKHSFLHGGDTKLRPFSVLLQNECMQKDSVKFSSPDHLHSRYDQKLRYNLEWP